MNARKPIAMLLLSVFLLALAFSAEATMLRGRVDINNSYGVIPLPSAVVEVWQRFPDGHTQLMAQTYTDAYGFYYLEVAVDGRIEVWANGRVLQARLPETTDHFCTHDSANYA
jgi:hypothetical protein